jgi:hypothetical protein
MSESNSSLEKKFSRIARWIAILYFVQVYAVDLMRGPPPKWYSKLLVIQSVVYGAAVLVFVAIEIGRRIRFSLRGLFISLFTLNLSLALLIGSHDEIVRIAGMAGLGLWCVVTALWIVCKSADDGRMEAPKSTVQKQQD